MGGELVKNENFKFTLDSNKRRSKQLSHRSFNNSFSNSNKKVLYLKTEPDDSSRKISPIKKKHKKQRLSIVAKEKNKELSNLELIQEKNPDKIDYDLIYNSIGEHNFMNALSDQARKEIIINMSLYRVKSDITLYAQGSVGNFWYIVHEGKLDFYINDKPVRSYEKGDSFGEVALMNNVPHIGTVKTVTDCELWAIKKENFNKIKEYLYEVNYKENLELINSFDLPLNDEIKSKMTHYLIKNTYKANDIIAKQGELASCIYLIKEGEVEYFRNNKLIETFKKNEYFGQNGLLQGHKRTADIIAKTDCIIYSISIEFFYNQFGEELEDQLYFSLMRLIFSKSSNFNNFNQHLLNKSFHFFQIKKFKKDDIIYEKGTDITKKICLVLEGNIIDKAANKIEGKRYAILFEDKLINTNEYKIKNDLIADSDSIIAEANFEEFKNSIGGSIKNANMISSEISAIENIKIFRNLPQEKLEIVQKNLKIEKFNNGNKIISAGKVGNKLFIIKKGRVDVFLNSKYVKSAYEGEDFGSKFLFFKNAKYLMTIIANGYVECYTLSADIFKSVLNPNLMDYFQKKFYLNDFSIELKDLENIKEIGKGSYGSVNLVCSKKNKQLYAVKALDIAQIKQENLEKNVELEKSILLKLDHPFITKMVKYLKNQTKIFFIMEYIQGKELWEVMRIVGLCNKNQTQFYGASILLAVDYLHKQKIIYRDIKPENVMITEKGYIKIIDFGTAKEIKDRTSSIVGTIQYMSPEVLIGKAYSFEIDMWSTAICMYELYCGKIPFGEGHEEDPMEYYNCIIKDDLTFPTFVNDEKFMSLLLNMLKKEPNKRLCEFEAIKAHPYFRDFDWEKLISFELQPPYLLENINKPVDVKRKTVPYLSYLKHNSNKPALKRLDTKRENNFKRWLNNF